MAACMVELVQDAQRAGEWTAEELEARAKLWEQRHRKLVERAQKARTEDRVSAAAVVRASERMAGFWADLHREKLATARRTS